MFDLIDERVYADHMAEKLTTRQRGILDVIETSMRERGYPPSVREIGEAIGLTSPSTVHSHLATLQRLGYLKRDPTKPRAIEVRFDPSSGAAIERRPVRHVPLVGDVAAGADVLGIKVAGRTMPLTQVSAMLLGELKLDAEAHFGRPVSRCVITVPANFDDGQQSSA